MTDHPRHPDSDDEIGIGADRDYTTGTPWGTYVLVFIGIVLVLGFVALHLAGVVGPRAH